jgi:phosphatidylserine decarboxylase
VNASIPAVIGAASALLMFAVASKWKLPWRLSLVASIVTAAVVAVPFALIYGRLGATGAVSTGAVVLTALAQMVVTLLGGIVLTQIRFWRDPERVSPAERGLVLSPADGQVIYVRSVDARSAPLVTKDGRDYSIAELMGTNPVEPGAHVIGVEMNILNVHVNRCPIGGRAELIKHIEGKFISLGKDEAPFVNARCTTVIEGEGFCVATVQIASRLVRRIENYLSVGQAVSAGQRLGRIRFGSQVAIVVPKVDHVSIDIKVGDEVTAGVTVLARYAPEIGLPK